MSMKVPREISNSFWLSLGLHVGEEGKVERKERDLGGYTANVQTGSPEATAAFDASHVHAQLGSLDGCHISPWAPSDDHQILQQTRCSACKQEGVTECPTQVL